MRQCNQINAVILRIFEEIRRRPLVIPAILAVITMFIYVRVTPDPVYHGAAAFTATVRHTEYKLDGSVQYVLKTEEYGRVLYNGSGEDDFYTGDELHIEGRMTFPDPPSNPGEFDYGEYLRNKGIRGIIKPDYVYKTSDGNALTRITKSLEGVFNNLRQYSLSVFDEEDRGMAGALFMGDTSLLDEEVIRSFKLSNCSHLLAVSGTHFAGFLMMLSEVFRTLHVQRKKAAPIYFCFCLATGMLTGWSESVTRACVMSICAFLARDYASGMSLAVIMLMVKDPYSCLSSGFQMSYAASLAIRLLSKSLSQKLLDKGFPQSLCGILTPVIAATIGMMPFWGRTGYYFSFIHLAAQVTASLLATAACVFFLPSVITGLSMSCSMIFDVLRLLTALCSSVSFSSASAAGLSPGFIYSMFSLIVLYLMPGSILRRILIKPALAAVFVSLGLMLASYITAPEVTVVFIDVGQGDSCLIMSEGRSVLIDGGVEAEGRYSVSAVLDYYGIQSVDIAVATHMDEDHIGGLEYLDSIGRIDTMYSCYDLRSGDVITMTDDLYLYCVWPHQVHDGGNEDSVVLRMEYEDFSILFTGDIGFDSESALITEGADIDADVLKVGHHGSAYSTSSIFLEYVSPQEAVISVVANSPYGHPAPATLERLEDYSCIIRRTDHEGAILYLLD